MKAVVAQKPGPPSVLAIRNIPRPVSRRGWVVIKIKAFGLNRSEMFTRQGYSPRVKFPRILGIECVGEVEDDPSGKFVKGQKVAALMGSMGRAFDGSYAEYTLLPLEIIFSFESSLSWQELGAIPEMFQTVSGSLNTALEIQKNETLLIRGGSSSIGMMACQLAKSQGLHVVSTTRNESKKKDLLANGADNVIIDDNDFYKSVIEIMPEGFDKVLELIGTKTLLESLRCTKSGGLVCMTGILGNEWQIKDFSPMGDIPSLVRLTVYMGEAKNLTNKALQNFLKLVEDKAFRINIDKVFQLDELVMAHEYMESNQAKGKLVVIT